MLLQNTIMEDEIGISFARAGWHAIVAIQPIVFWDI